ncbi:MAG: dihydropteroate synthase [Rhodoglobus sp.]
MTFVLPPLTTPHRQIGAREFDFSHRVAVMAIINRTPDSFYDGGANFELDHAIAACLRAVDDGADWVDIGGVPFAPGAPLDVEEEMDRVLPVVRALHERSDVVISVDTFHSDVARHSIAAGAHVINDTTGLSDPRLASVVADSDASLVLVHSRAKPRTQFARPEYDNVAVEVRDFLAERIDRATAAGVPQERLFIDPGHDLNKNTLHSLALTRHLDIITALGLPTLVALSNKDFIGEVLDRPKHQRREGSLAAAVACILGGARIVRVHEVAESVAAVQMAEAILGLREPAYLKHNMSEANER